MASNAPAVRLICLCGITAVSAGSMLSGAAWLEQPLLYVPAGNWVAWVFLASLNAIAFFVTAPTTWLRWPARVMLGLALAWYPVSVALMGNLRLSGGHEVVGSAWTGYTMLLTVGPLSIMVAQAVVSLRARFARRTG